MEPSEAAFLGENFHIGIDAVCPESPGHRGDEPRVPAGL